MMFMISEFFVMILIYEDFNIIFHLFLYTHVVTSVWNIFNNILIFLAGLKSSNLDFHSSLQKSSSFLTCKIIFFNNWFLKKS